MWRRGRDSLKGELGIAVHLTQVAYLLGNIWEAQEGDN